MIFSGDFGEMMRAGLDLDFADDKGVEGRGGGGSSCCWILVKLAKLAISFWMVLLMM